MRKLIYILWPSFVVAVFGVVVMFALMDPVDLRWVGPFELGRRAGYTLGFLLMWAFAACSSAFTWFLMRPPAEVNEAAPDGEKHCA